MQGATENSLFLACTCVFVHARVIKSEMTGNKYLHYLFRVQFAVWFSFMLTIHYMSNTLARFWNFQCHTALLLLLRLLLPLSLSLSLSLSLFPSLSPCVCNCFMHFFLCLLSSYLQLLKIFSGEIILVSRSLQNWPNRCTKLYLGDS